MSRAFNFSAGPAALPDVVLERARDELLEFRDQRASVMELSHRGKAFIAVAEQSEADLRELLAVPADYAVLFLQGGATQHFAQLAMNLAGPEDSADYVITGDWGKKAHKEAGSLVRTRVAASSQSGGFRDIPARESWDLDPKAAYVHITPNETIHGVEFHATPEVGSVPLVADMSSTLLSRPLDVSRYGLIYAGAQKNIGPAGLTLVILRRDLLERVRPGTPAIFTYKAQAEQGSMLNTPPTLAWYLAGLVFQWLKAEGGLAAMAERNRNKAELLYQYIDASEFYSNPVAPAARSWMNVPFVLANADLDAAFLRESEAEGLMSLKGHRAVGGMRASLYNAMPLAGVQALIDFMDAFARRHG